MLARTSHRQASSGARNHPVMLRMPPLLEKGGEELTLPSFYEVSLVKLPLWG